MNKNRSNRISTLGSRLTSVISVSLVLVIVGIIGMGLEASRRISDEVRGSMGLVVKLSPSATPADIDRVRKTVAANPAIAACTFSSAESILEEESRLMGEDLGELLDENPFGPEFELKLKPDYACADSVAVVTATLSADAAIDDMVAQTAVIDNINRLVRRFTAILIAVGIAMLVISFALINNTVSLAVYSRRFVIHTMKLVGATGAFIRRPFLAAGAVTGVAASAVAVALTAALRAYAATFDPTVESCLPWSVMSAIFGVMALFGVAICTLASAMATNRYLRTDYDDMFF